MQGYPAMFRMKSSKRRVLAAIAVLAIVASACGASTKSTTASGVEVSGGAPLQIDNPIVSGLPAVSVFDLATGEQVNLADAASGEKTTILWIWAPH